MKTNRFSLVAGFLLAVTFTSCSSDDDNSGGNTNSGGESSKTDTKTYTSSGTYTLQYPGSTITEIEIYALGAGGGGGLRRVCSSGLCEYQGTSGGGAAATYVKLGNLQLIAGEEVVLNIAIGGGGSGSVYAYPSCNYGCDGGNGGRTAVGIIGKNISVGADGGSAGLKTGHGTGALASSLPTQSTFYKDGISVAGGSGSTDAGGKAAKIAKGSLSSFGGGNEGNGGRGVGETGYRGADGLARVVVKYQ